MIIATSIDDLRQSRKFLPTQVGLVPTMGFLHPGHLSLIETACCECSSVVVSIFVNPTQFGPAEDLTTYPRDVQRDLALLESAGVDLVWTPTSEIMYPAGFQTWVQVEELSKPLEGALRPGHFRGVATVVAKLFNVVQPDLAYFGQKDAQQLVVIRRMVQDLNFPIEIRVCPIAREPDGLAMSSRNVNLSPTERKAARVLSRSLFAARDAYHKGERRSPKLRSIINEAFAEEPLANLQYASCAHPETLQELDEISGQALLSIAAFIGKTRLIDNILLP